MKVFVTELLKYLDKKEMVQAFADWKYEAPPLTGKFLKEQNCPDGVVMGRVRLILLEKWIDSRFQLSQDELGRLIPEVLDGLKDFIAEMANKKAAPGKRKHVKN